MKSEHDKTSKESNGDDILREMKEYRFKNGNIKNDQSIFIANHRKEPE